MRKFLLLIAGLAVFLVVWPATAVAAAPQRFMFTDTFPDNVCGFTGTTTINVVDIETVNADGTFTDRIRVKQAFTSDSGKTITVDAAGQQTTSDLIPNGDGTFTALGTFIGLPEKVQIQKGPVLSLDAGTVTITRVFAVDQNGDLQLVSQQLSGLHGPHPDLASDFTLFCDEVTPYLMDP